MKTVCGMQRSGFVLPTPRLGGGPAPSADAFYAEAGFVLVAS